LSSSLSSAGVSFPRIDIITPLLSHLLLTPHSQPLTILGGRKDEGLNARFGGP